MKMNFEEMFNFFKELEIIGKCENSKCQILFK